MSTTVRLLFWVGLGVAAVWFVTLIALVAMGCSDDGSGSDANRGNVPPAIVADNADQHEAVIAQIDWFSEIKGPVDLQHWTLHTTGDLGKWQGWLAARALPNTTTGHTDHARKEILVWAHNVTHAGPLHVDVCTGTGHELEHVTNRLRPHPFPEVDLQAQRCAEWLVARRSP